MTDLLNVDAALECILGQLRTLAPESVPLTEALNRVLAEDLCSEIDLPPFPNSSMDGYAVRSEDVAGASQDTPVRLKVVMDVPAGAAPDRAIKPGEAARIMTGAPMPEGADSVVPVEQTDARWHLTPSPLGAHVSIYKRSSPGDHVRPAGEDLRAGQVALTAGTIIRPQEIGALAGLGRANVPVIRQPHVAILGTGNELVGVDQPLAPGKIRDTNSYTLEALVATCGGAPIRLPVARDTLDDVRALFYRALEHNPDMIISSAGVSVGAADLVRTVLDELGRVDLWRINLRPGKPLAFGQLRGVPFFGLPGNPVSAMVTFDVIVRPALLKLAGKPDDISMTHALVGEELQSDGRRTYVRVRLSRENGQFVARTTGTQSSGALMSMVLADGLLIIPEGMTRVEIGTELPVRLLRNRIE